MPLLDLRLHHAARAAYERLDIGFVPERWIVSRVLVGRVATRTAGREATVGPGDVMVHPPRVRFSERADVPGVHEFFEFDLSLDRRDLFDLLPVALVVRLGDPDAWSAEFDRLLAAGDDARRTLAALALLARLTGDWETAGGVPRPPEASPGPSRFDPVLREMEARLAEPLARRDLAALAGLHPGSFDRAFRAERGVAPMAWLREVRLRRAADLLASTDLTLEAIAERTGFSDASNLSRAFRAARGFSPGAWRRSASGTKPGYGATFPREPGSG